MANSIIISAIDIGSPFISGLMITNAIVVIKVLAMAIFAIFFWSFDNFIGYQNIRKDNRFFRTEQLLRIHLYNF